MKDNKKSKGNIKLSSSFFNTKGKIIGVFTAGAVIISAVIIFMVIESSYGKLTVKNNTEVNLEYAKIGFVDSEGAVGSTMQTGAVNSNTSLTEPVTLSKLLFTNSNMEVRFKFENHDELLTDVGTFNSDFDGNIKISFEKTDDPNLITLKIKASNGFLRSKSVDCDEEFTINLSEGAILE